LEPAQLLEAVVLIEVVLDPLEEVDLEEGELIEILGA